MTSICNARTPFSSFECCSRIPGHSSPALSPAFFFSVGLAAAWGAVGIAAAWARTGAVTPIAFMIVFLPLYLLQNHVCWLSAGVSGPVRRAVELTTDRGRRKFASNGKSGIPPGNWTPDDTVRRSVFFLLRTGRCRPACTCRGKGTTRTTDIRLCVRASSPVVVPPIPLHLSLSLMMV